MTTTDAWGDWLPATTVSREICKGRRQSSTTGIRFFGLSPKPVVLLQKRRKQNERKCVRIDAIANRSAEAQRRADRTSYRTMVRADWGTSRRLDGTNPL